MAREALGQAPAGFSAATKCFCTEHEQRVADFVFGVMGPAATLWDDVVKGLVYAPGYTIMGGTSNVMRNILGERCPRLATRATLMSRATLLVGLLAAAVAAIVPAAQPASASTPPTVPPGTELGTPIPTDFVPLVDDTGTISVEVPSSWNDVDAAPDGETPSIVASPDRDGLLGSFDVPGMTYRADSYQADTLRCRTSLGVNGEL